MHTENIASTDLIRAAVVAQLAKPAVHPSAAALLTKGFKYEVLTWVGIVGGALTLFGHMSAALTLADWARLLVQNWKAWTHAFWVWAFGWMGIHLEPDWPPALSFMLFGLLLAIGQAVKFNMTINDGRLVDSSQGKSFQLISWRAFFYLFSIVPTVFVALVIGFELQPSFYKLEIGNINVYLCTIFFSPLIALIVFARHRLHAACSVFFDRYIRYYH